MKSIFSGFMNLLFPPRCVFCGKPLARGVSGYCKKCEKSIPYTDGTFEPGGAITVCMAPLKYRDSVRKAFHRFKFKGKVSYAGVFGRIVADEIKRAASGKYDIITWIPVSRERKRDRGYDQSMLLAYAVALELDDVAVDTLTKVRDVTAQSELKGLNERQSNISGAFEVSLPELIEGKRVLLIDDIYTTGATMDECARCLMGAGAKEVLGAVFAKA